MSALPVSRATVLSDRLNRFSDCKPDLKAVVYHGLFILGLLFAVSVFFLPIINPDIFWHLSAGRSMLSGNGIPSHDFLSWTRENSPWIDFEWLTQIIYHRAYSSAGFKGLLFLKALILSASLLFFVSVMRLYGLWNFLFLAIPLWSAGLLPNLDLRPENFTLLFFSAEIYILERLRLGKLPWGIWKFSIFFTGFFALWANLHAGFASGLALLALYSLGEFLSAKPSTAGKPPPAALFSKTICLCAGLLCGFAGTLLNAYGWKIYSVLFLHIGLMNNMRNFITEWRPSQFSNQYQIYYWIFMFSAFFAVLLRTLKTKTFTYSHILVLLFFAPASAMHSRNTFFMVMTALPYTAYALSGMNWTGKKINTLKLVCSLIFIAVIMDRCLFLKKEMTYTSWLPKYAPAGASNFLIHNAGAMKNLRMYNPWTWGGYLGYKLYPDYKIFADGRYIFHKYLEEPVLSMQSPQAWESFLRKYNFQLVLLDRAKTKSSMSRITKTGRMESFLRPFYLFYMPKETWALVYWDSKSLVFVKRNSLDKDLLKKHEFEFLRPDDFPAVAAMLEEKEISSDKIKKEIGIYLRTCTKDCGKSAQEAISLLPPI